MSNSLDIFFRPDQGPNCFQWLLADNTSKQWVNQVYYELCLCLFDLILYVPSTIFQLCRDRLNQY